MYIPIYTHILFGQLLGMKGADGGSRFMAGTRGRSTKGRFSKYESQRIGQMGRGWKRYNQRHIHCLSKFVANTEERCPLQDWRKKSGVADYLDTQVQPRNQHPQHPWGPQMLGCGPLLSLFSVSKTKTWAAKVADKLTEMANEKVWALKGYDHAMSWHSEKFATTGTGTNYCRLPLPNIIVPRRQSHGVLWVCQIKTSGVRSWFNSKHHASKTNRKAYTLVKNANTMLAKSSKHVKLWPKLE